MNKRMMILAMIGLTLAGCETGMPHLTEIENPSGQADTLRQQAEILDAEATRRVNVIIQATRETELATRQALDAGMMATRDAQAAQARQVEIEATATAVQRQSDAEATAQVVQATSTAQAQQVEATRQSRAATATATAEAATSTAVAYDNQVLQTETAVYLSGVEATRQAVARQTQKEERTAILTTFAGWALLLVGLLVAGFIGWQLLPIVAARLRVIRRKVDEAEPIVMMQRDADGNERIALPLRSFWQLMSGNDIPEPPPPELQDRLDARTQLTAVVAAGRGGHKRIVTQPVRETTNTPTIRVVEPSQVQPWLEDVETQLLEETNQ